MGGVYCCPRWSSEFDGDCIACPFISPHAHFAFFIFGRGGGSSGYRVGGLRYGARGRVLVLGVGVRLSIALGPTATLGCGESIDPLFPKLVMSRKRGEWS